MDSEFAPSLMCMDFLKIARQIEILNKKADFLHIDIMDGHYCKNLSLSPAFTHAIYKVAKIPMDVHLMTTKPMDWIKIFADAGATYISPHAETINTDAFRVLGEIESLGCKRGVVLNPATPIEAVERYLNRIDILTIMTVDVGYAGQKFIPEMLEKIQQAKRLKRNKNYQYKIQVDGSCNKNTYRALHEAGAEIFVVGSSGLFGLDVDLEAAYDMMLRQFAEETSSLN